jgi:hypothetical protein
MTVDDIAAVLDGTLVAGAPEGARLAAGGYVSDLLSDVIANAREGDVWITLQRHVNVVAVAQLKSLAAIVLVNGRLPETDTAARADQERIPIVSTRLTAFDAAGRLYATGLRGRGTP